MGACQFCGNPAGFLKSKHKECEQKNVAAKTRLPQLLADAFSLPIAPEDFLAKFDEVATACWLTNAERRTAIMEGLRRQAEAVLEDHVLTASEERRIVAFQTVMGVADDELSGTQFQNALAKASILRDLDEGKIQSRVKFDGHLPVLLGKTEELIWIFANSPLWELRTKTSYVGRSNGVSIRLARGLYYRVGSSRGERVQNASMEHVDTGAVFLSSKNLYFSGGTKTFKLPYSKMVSVKLFSDGLEIVKDGANPKPQVLGLDDPAFAANLISRLA
jgi:hypothetical protein